MEKFATLSLTCDGFEKVVRIPAESYSIETFELILDCAKENLFREFLKHGHKMKSSPIDRRSDIRQQTVRELIQHLEDFERSMTD